MQTVQDSQVNALSTKPSLKTSVTSVEQHLQKMQCCEFLPREDGCTNRDHYSTQFTHTQCSANFAHTHSYQNADVKHPPFFRSSGFPFLTVATNMSPEPAAGSLFRRPLMPCTAITYKFFAPAHRRMAISSASTRLMDMCTTANTRSVVAATALMLAPDACSVTFIKNPLGLKSLIISACVEWGAGLCCIADCHSSVD